MNRKKERKRRDLDAIVKKMFEEIEPDPAARKKLERAFEHTAMAALFFRRQESLAANVDTLMPREHQIRFVVTASMPGQGIVSDSTYMKAFRRFSALVHDFGHVDLP